MTLTGLSITALAGIGISAGAVTLVLYILKLRRRPVGVPFSPIWQRVVQQSETRSLWSKLKRLLSLLLQLAMLAALTLALGDPRPSKAWSEGRNIVILIDTSASMQAVDVQPSRLEVARTKARKLVQSLGPNDRALIAELGASPKPLTTLTHDLQTLNKALDQVEAKDTVANAHEGLAFALDTLRGLQLPQVVLLSDGALGDTKSIATRLNLKDIKLTFVPIGKGGRNVALTAFSVRRYPLDGSRYEVMLEISNTADTSAEVELTLLGDGEVVDLSQLKLAAGERLPRFYADLGGANAELEARVRLLNGHDALPADNAAYALLPERRQVRVLVISPGNSYLEAALLLDEYLSVTSIHPGDAVPEQTFDVTILDGVAPKLPARSGALLYLNPPEQGAPVKRRRAIEEFGFDSWQRKSPFLRWMAMENIQVTRGYALQPEEGDRVVGASELGPILVTGERQKQRFLQLAFDPRDSDFVLRVGWPLFLLNTINTFAGEDASYLSSYKTGRVWHLPLPGDHDRAQLKYPSGRVTPLPVQQGRAIAFGDRAGFFDLQSPDGTLLSRFAANLSDRAESTLEISENLNLGESISPELSEFSPGARRSIWQWLLLGVFALSVLEWLSYHRRVTV